MTPWQALEQLIRSDEASAALLTDPAAQGAAFRLSRGKLAPEWNPALQPCAHYRVLPSEGQGLTMAGLDGLESLRVEISGWGPDPESAENVTRTLRTLLDGRSSVVIEDPAGGASRTLQLAKCSAPFDFGDPDPSVCRSVMFVDLWFTAL